MRFSLFLFTVLFALCLSPRAMAIIELSGNFGYDKKVYGSERQNALVRRSYNASLAVILFSRTALELNYSHGLETTTEKTDLLVTGTTVRLAGLQNKVTSNVYGIGLRQAFAGRDAVIRPFLSMGYAKQFIEDLTEYNFVMPDDSALNLNSGINKRRQDSVFATFSLQFRLTQTLALNGSVKTIFQAFQFNRAADDVRYTVGFSWIF
jgi:uncharacterized protein YhjY with autotransporter beta-barrel domain